VCVLCGGVGKERSGPLCGRRAFGFCGSEGFFFAWTLVVHWCGSNAKSQSW
jgi:hypothetical protein